jgi:adenylate cyclase
MVGLFEALCRRLHAAGIPVDRALLAWPTLHPLFIAEQITWRRDGGIDVQRFVRGDADHPAFKRGPFGFLILNGLDRLRRRIVGPSALRDFPILEDLHAEGFTDYVATATEFGVARLRPANTFGYTGIVTSWATTRDAGFTDADIAALSGLMRLLSVSARATLQNRLLKNLADAYLGPSVGERVLAGAIRRGEGETIRAVLWYTDLRGSTRLSQRMSPPDYLAMLNRYYDATAGAAIAAGGEVLAFVGDAVLAVFPHGNDPAAAGRAATAAAVAALERAASDPDLAFGIAMGSGEVLFGNVGVPERLSFSVIGEAVNAVQRIEAHTKLAGHRVLATASF